MGAIEATPPGGCAQWAGGAKAWVRGRPWSDWDNYAQALQRTLGLCAVLLIGARVYYWLLATQGAVTATTWFVIVIISCKDAVKISRPALGEANRDGLIHLGATAVAGAVALALMLLGRSHPVACFVILLAVVMPVYYCTRRFGLSDTFPLLFCSTLVSVVFMALAAGSHRAAVEDSLNGMLAMLVAVAVILLFAVTVFPRTGSLESLRTMKKMLKEVKTLRQLVMAEARLSEGGVVTYPFLIEGEDPPEATTVRRQQEACLSKIFNSAGGIEQKLDISENEGYCRGLWGLGIYLPCWPCHCMGSRLPRQELLQLASAVHSTAQLLSGMGHLFRVLRNMDPEALRRLRSVYQKSTAAPGGQGYHGEACALVGLVLNDLADSFPDGMQPVRALCPAQHLHELQRCMSAMKELELQAWNGVVAAEEQRRPVFEAGVLGLSHAGNFAAFKFALQQVVLALGELHALVNASLQGIPWSAIPSASETQPAGADISTKA